LDAELFDLVRRLLDGWGTGEDDLALEVIEAVGPGGHFLGQAHTRTHMRELWMPRFFDRRPWEEWETAGRPGPRDAARDRVREILAEHEPDPPPEDAERELARIVESHEGETKGAAHGGRGNRRPRAGAARARRTARGRRRARADRWRRGPAGRVAAGARRHDARGRAALERGRPVPARGGGRRGHLPAVQRDRRARADRGRREDPRPPRGDGHRQGRPARPRQEHG